jgi:hypothetical protein
MSYINIYIIINIFIIYYKEIYVKYILNCNSLPLIYSVVIDIKFFINEQHKACQDIY